MKIVGKKEWGLIVEVDPKEFSPDHTYTFECEVDGVMRQWTNVRPQREEDGSVCFYLPIERH